jgi:hypothetical protein
MYNNLSTNQFNHISINGYRRLFSLGNVDDPRFIILLTDGYPDNSSSAMQIARQNKSALMALN